MKVIDLSIPRRGPLAAAVLLAFFSYGVTGTCLQAQAPAPANPPAAEPAEIEAPQSPTIRTTVDEVSLDLVVHDKGKKLILDLKPEDLTVMDNNTPVKLQNLRLVRGDTNRKHMVTFLFDPFVGPTAKNARSSAEKILNALPTANYSYAVMDLRGRLRVVQRFTEDRKVALEAVREATASDYMLLQSGLLQDINILTEHADKERNVFVAAAEKNVMLVARTGADESGAHVEMGQRAYAQTLVDAMQEFQRSMQDKHGYMNLSALLAIVHSQQKLNDRKALIYFTHNQSMDSRAKQVLKNIAAESGRAGMAIYVVDMDAINQSRHYMLDNAALNGKAPYNPAKIVVNPHGETITPMQQQDGGPIQGSIQPDGSRSWGTQQDIQVMTDFHRQGPAFDPNADDKPPIQQLSEDTGGVYMDAQNNLKKPLQQMVEDLGTYYEATYIPPIKEYDGSFRTISVKPLRKNVRVQSKAGYYALAPGAEAGIRPFEVPLIKALSQAAPPSDIKFHAAVLRFGELPDGNTNALALEIPLSELQLNPDLHTNLYSAHVAIFAQIKDEAGKVIEKFGDDMTRRGATESLDRDKSTSITFERHFITTPGKYTLEVAVADPVAGKMGVQQTAFEIPKSGTSLSVSDMVLVSKLSTIPEAEEDAFNPLRYEHNRITPALSTHLPEGAKGLSLFFMLHPDPAAKDQATLEMEVIHNGVPGRKMPLPFTRDSIQTAIPYLASFGQKPLSPGKYEIRAYLEQGGKTAEQTLAFTVGDESSAAASLAAKSSDAGVTAIAAPPEPNAPGQLTITVPKNPIPPLAPQEAQQILDDARQRALSYGESLPNFMCVEVTNRSTDSSGMGDWKLKDTIVESLRYRDKQESRVTLEINGQPSATQHDSMKGALSEGEFGGVLRSIFKDGSHANFHWKETDELNGGPVQVYDYSVAQPNSGFGVVGTDGREIMVGFHGQVFIDAAAHSVRRVTLIADLPEHFSTRASSMRVDYDYVSINSRDYLLPVSAEMRLVKGKHSASMNTIEFRNYRHFGSNMRILNYNPVDPVKN